MDTNDRSPEKPRRASTLADRVRRLSPWSLLIGAIVFAMAFGLEELAVVSAALGAGGMGIARAFGDRIRERFERQPDLRLAVAEDGKFVGSSSLVSASWK